MKATLEVINGISLLELLEITPSGEPWEPPFIWNRPLRLISMFLLNCRVRQKARFSTVRTSTNICTGSRAEYIDIGSWPVQFLVAGNAQEEAIKEAVVTEVEGIKTRVMTAEHLIAIALRTGRAKDHARIVQFVAEGALDRAKLHGILGKHKLLRVWEKFARKYLNE